MEESNTQDTGRLTDWIILVFVLVVMGLLIADLDSNIESELDRSNRPEVTNAVQAASPESPGVLSPRVSRATATKPVTPHAAIGVRTIQ